MPFQASRDLCLAALSLVLVGCVTVQRDTAIDQACATAPSCPAGCDRCDGDTCHIDCDGDACRQRIVECAPGMDCALHCDGASACQAANVIGPEHGTLTMVCEGASACDDAVVAAEGGLDLRCDGSHACSSAHLLCGTGSCDWTCRQADACADLVVR